MEATEKKTSLQEGLDADSMSFFEMLAVAKKSRG
jgi:predicted  nucleic acid-binding Zn-ribbon protein